MQTNTNDKSQQKNQNLNEKGIYKIYKRKQIRRHSFRNPTVQDHQKPIVHASHKIIHLLKNPPIMEGILVFYPLLQFCYSHVCIKSRNYLSIQLELSLVSLAVWLKFNCLYAWYKNLAVHPFDNVWCLLMCFAWASQYSNYGAYVMILNT